MNIFITSCFYVYKSRFPRAVYCSIRSAQVDLAALAASIKVFTMNINLRWIDWWKVVLSELFNNHFVTLYTKPMLQITGYIIQTTYFRRMLNPTKFSSDHITKIKFLFIFTWFISFIGLVLMMIIIMELSLAVIVRVCVLNICQIKLFKFF